MEFLSVTCNEKVNEFQSIVALSFNKQFSTIPASKTDIKCHKICDLRNIYACAQHSTFKNLHGVDDVCMINRRSNHENCFQFLQRRWLREDEKVERWKASPFATIHHKMYDFSLGLKACNLQLASHQFRTTFELEAKLKNFKS